MTYKLLSFNLGSSVQQVLSTPTIHESTAIALQVQSPTEPWRSVELKFNVSLPASPHYLQLKDGSGVCFHDRKVTFHSVNLRTWENSQKTVDLPLEMAGIRHIAELNNNAISILTESGQVYCIEGQKPARLILEQTESSAVAPKAHASSLTHTLILYEDGKLLSINNESKKNREFERDDPFTGLTSDVESGLLYLCSKGGNIYKFNPEHANKIELIKASRNTGLQKLSCQNGYLLAETETDGYYLPVNPSGTDKLKHVHNHSKIGALAAYPIPDGDDVIIVSGGGSFAAYSFQEGERERLSQSISTQTPIQHIRVFPHQDSFPTILIYRAAQEGTAQLEAWQTGSGPAFEKGLVEQFKDSVNDVKGSATYNTAYRGALRLTNALVAAGTAFKDALLE